jgi:hypothetical protein
MSWGAAVTLCVYNDFWHPFCDYFSHLFSKFENSVFEQQYCTLASFRPPETSPFRIDFSLENHVFSRHPLGPHFSSFYVDLLQNLSIKIPPPVGETRFPVLDGVRWGDVSFSRRVLLKGGFGAAGSA